ncbi:MAG: ornithine cyclodeaminase family protein, partial [Gammaproteobacteria bacterium]|nr:ornithine cyclodeaminase family protein [Gammaproteobacteria bacterium]
MSGQIQITWLNGRDIEALAFTDDEILEAVEAGLRFAGEGETVIEPRVHLRPDPAFNGHFNVLRGYVAPLGTAGVKIV